MFTLEHFLEQCVDALDEDRPQLVVREVLKRFVSSANEVERVLGTPRRADIVTLYRGPRLTVLNVTWAPHMRIYPHDHRLWAIIGIYGGREDNTFYKRERQGVVRAGGKRLDENESLVLGDQIIHAVENPLNKITGAIHIYGGDFFTVKRSEFDPDTMEERNYDVEKTKQLFLAANNALSGSDD